MILNTFTGYVTSRGVEAKDIAGYRAYVLTLKGTLKVKKGEAKLCLGEFTFWGKNYEYLEKYIAPYDQITAVGELTNVRFMTAKKEGDMDGIALSLRGLTISLPKRDDADGANKSRVTQQRRETLKPAPVVSEEEIPF